MKTTKIALFLLSFLLIFGSCRSNKTIPYFKNIPPSEYSKIEQAEFTEPTIAPDDILDISIQTADPEASMSVRAAAINADVAAPVTQRVTGFMVDKNGDVELPIIGNIHVGGMTTFEARQVIREKAASFYVKPAIQVRFVNFKITVIGEVARPSSYTVPNEKVTILDAIGLAGDLTIFGKRENVLLIREHDGNKEMVRFNLNDSDLFSSPFYYLKPNDIIYVEPSKAKINATDASRFSVISVIASVVSAAAIFITVFN